MTKNTKLLLAGAGIVVLFLAYKKGVFGGNTPSASQSASTDVQLPSDAVTVTPTGEPQGVILPILPNTFSQAKPLTESYA